MNTTKIRVFSDFDGTITIKDLGDEIFREFGQFEPYRTQLASKEIDIKTYWKELCKTFPKGFTESSIIEYALETPIDAYFKSFVDYCRENDYPLHVVSDGFESYIHPILEREGLSHLPVNCNYLDFSVETIQPVFPGAVENCECFCASCKRNSVINKADEDEIIVFIGDGYSDYCAAEHSDIIFAKKHLAAYCNEHKLPHYPFHSFFDVKRLLQEAVSKGKLKKRNQAEMNRKRAFEYE